METYQVWDMKAPRDEGPFMQTADLALARQEAASMPWAVIEYYDGEVDRAYHVSEYYHGEPVFPPYPA